MTLVRRAVQVSAPVDEVEALWFDLERWPSWVDGFARLVAVREPWPRAGGEVVWESGPYGRGRVVERSVGQVAGSGQSAEVEDDRLSARQEVSFAPAPGGEGTEVALSLDYRIKGARIGMFVVDVLFVRRAVGDLLRRTLEGFAREVRAAPLR